MQIYLKSYILYGFNWEKAFKARYIAKNSLKSQKHQKDNKNNMKYKSNALAEG